MANVAATIRAPFRSCPVCRQAAEAETLHTQRFVAPPSHPAADGYDVVHCAACGFVYADLKATQADFDRYYAECSKYEDATSSTGSGESPLDRERLEQTATILARQLPCKDSRILDMGCAGGGLLQALSLRGYNNLAGIDPSARCVRMTQQRVGQAWQGWLGALPDGVGRFDCILLSHVLEHVLDLQSALSALHPLLHTNGVVYAEVPNAAAYQYHLYAPFQDFNTEHINHFSLHSLNNAFAGCRFQQAAPGGERVFRPSAHTTMPAVYGFYKASAADVPIAPDTGLRPAIERYVELSAELLRQIDAAIGAVVRRSPELVVWGAGQLSLKLLAETCLSDARLTAVVDSNPVHHGKTLAGAPIVPPQVLRDYPHPVLVSTLMHQREIANLIEALGVSNEVILLPEATAAQAAAARTTDRAPVTGTT